MLWQVTHEDIGIRQRADVLKRVSNMFVRHFTEKDDILSDITSRLWFTYRKNFQAIGEWHDLAHTDYYAIVTFSNDWFV